MWLRFILLISCIAIFSGCSGTEDFVSFEGNGTIDEDTIGERSTYYDCIGENVNYAHYDDAKEIEQIEYFADLVMPYRTISAGRFHSAAIMPDGTLWAWGFNGLGQLGDGTWDNRHTPVQTGVYADWVSVSAGQHFTVALRSDGSLWSWGSNDGGSLGSREIPPGGIPDGWVGTRYAPLQIGTDTDWVNFSVGHMFVIAIKSDGSLWGWGSNSFRQLGGDDPYWHDMSLEWEPVQIGSCTDWVYIASGGAHVMALRADGSLWGWGDNSFGRIGDGNLEGRGLPNSLPQHEPTQIGAYTDWISISAVGSHTLGLRANGTLWAWGVNSDGQLGDGTTENRAVPVQIGTDTDWTRISAGNRHSMAIKADGSLWGWGANSDGQLVNRAAGIHAHPVRILENVVEVSAGINHAIALLSDSSIWAWGSNRYGQLGDGTIENRPIPVRITESAHPNEK